MTKSIFMYDGVKSSMLWDEGSPAWESMNDVRSTSIQIKALAPIFRGISMISNDVSRMPFSIRKGDEVIDGSQDYKNALEFLPDPRRFFSQLSTSLDTTGCAYALPISNKAGYVKELRYAAPGTIEPVYSLQNGELLHFKRTINNRPSTELEPMKDLLYWWLSDEAVELGAPTVYPLMAAKAAAEVLINLDSFISIYFKRGLIRPIIVSVEGDPPESERDRMESWFNSLWSGLKNAFRLKIFRAGSVKVEQIGDGLDQLQNQELNDEKRKDIALALGIPYAMLFSEAANYSTLDGDTKFYYQNTIEPRCEFIAEVMNSQLLRPNSRYKGVRFEFTPETLDIYQTDEQKRATSLKTYVSAGVPLLVACEMLGIELSEEQRAQMVKPVSETVTEEEPQEPEQEPVGFPYSDELAKWRRKALRAIRAGKPASVTFDTETIPRAITLEIKTRLKKAQADADVIQIFQDIQEQAGSDLRADAQEITSAIIALTEVLADGK